MSDKIKQGEFYTPEVWVDEAHKYLDKTFGDNWRDEYVVWDSSCGLGQLTKDYKFKNLYLSSLKDEDIEFLFKNNINDEGIRFQYDFLNDPYNKLPEKLRQHIENKDKILFLLNPPYVASSNMRFKSDTELNKTGIADTNIKDSMRRDGFGAATKQLYAHFFYKLWRFNKFGNVSIGIFTPPLFLTGTSYKKFRKEFFKRFKYEGGFMFQASEFEGLSKLWGITFTMWKPGIEENGTEFFVDLKYNDKGVVKDYDYDPKIPEFKPYTDNYWDEFKYDSVVYSLFNNSSQQSSMRNVEYKNKLWDIENEFFWLSNKQMRDLAFSFGFNELYEDTIKFDKERHVYLELLKIRDKLSPEALDVLDTATDLLIKSFKYREELHKKHPEYHLHSWDAGYAQLKLIWKEYMMDDWKMFREKYKKLNDRLIPFVYELGFLER